MKNTPLNVAERLGKVVCRLFESGESTGSLGVTAAKALPLTDPACLAVFGSIAVGVLGFQSWQTYRDWAAGKTLDDFVARADGHLDGLAGAARWVAEREELTVPVPEHDPRYPTLALYTLLREEFLNAELRDRGTEERQARIHRVVTDLLTRHQGLQDQLAAGFATQAESGEKVLREVELARDDLYDLRDAVDRGLEHAPPLAMPSSRKAAGKARQDLVAADRFHYRTEQVDLIGQGELLAELSEFCGGGEPFLWWLLTGPGGAGKSRLALQACKNAREAGWWTGFLGRDHGVAGGYDQWHEWSPRRPTLAVIDYVVARHQKVAAWLARLAERADGFDHPVRILLLERSADEQTDPWFKSLIGGATESAGRRRDHQHAPPREVPPLEEEALWAILTQVWDASGHPHPERTETLRTLRAVDPAARPLFAAFFAEAFAAGLGPGQAWEPQTLTEAILEREVETWRQAGFDGEHANLLALATMAGRIEVGDLADLGDEAGRLPVPTLHAFDSAAFARMNGFAGSDAHDGPAPFEPDFLGECFVLQRLGGTLAVTALNEHALVADAARLAKWAWRHRAPQMGAFTARVFRDFPDGPGPTDRPTALGRLVEPPSGEESGTRAYRLNAVATALYHTVGDAEDASDAWLDRLGNWHADVEHYTKALFNRGLQREHFERAEAAEADYTAVIDTPAAPGEVKAGAHLNRGLLRRDASRAAEAEADFSSAVDLDNVSAGQRAKALLNRGVLRQELGRGSEAEEDFAAVLRIPDAPAEQRAGAHFNLGLLKQEQKLPDEAIEEWTSAFEITDAGPGTRGTAMFNCGTLHRDAGRLKRADEAYTLVVDLPNVPVEAFRLALADRGAVRFRLGKLDAARADVDRVIAMDGLPARIRAMSLLNRGVVRLEVDSQDREGACADFRAAAVVARENDLPDISARCDAALRDLECGRST